MEHVDASSPPTGHRLVPHVADLIVEAWGGTRIACLEQAVLGLVESFADIAGVEATTRVPISVRAADDEDALVSLLEEVVYTVDALDAVPVAVDLRERGDGGVEGFLATVPTERLEAVGAPPKGVSRSDLRIAARGGRWRCHVLVDV
jgi:SHS2 domain-containing protein